MSVYTRTFTPPINDSSSGILKGLRFSVKDCIDIEGIPTSCGLHPPLIARANHTAPVVSKILSQGALLTGKTNLDPLASDARGRNEYLGDIKHPTQSGYTCLGSSGGAAASVLSDSLAFALGTDSGGSIRAPAAACDLYGLKLKNSSVSQLGITPLEPLLESIGILAKDPQILVKVCEALGIETKHHEPITYFAPPPELLAKCDREIQDAFLEILKGIPKEYLKEFSDMKYFSETIELRKPLAAYAISEALGTWSGALTDNLIAIKKYGDSLNQVDLERTRAEVRILRSQIAEAFPINAAILTPTLPYHPFTETFFAKSLPINHFLALANICDFAALSAPTTEPFRSVQLVGTSEKVIFSALEQLF